MNKQEAIDELKKYKVGFGEAAAVRFDRIVSVISQIHEPQKVVVPKFVAEWIEIHKKSFAEASAIDMYDNITLDNSHGYYHEVWLWVIDHHYDFIKAWHEGYEVEKEKLYTVEIPNPVLTDNSDSVTVLMKIDSGVVLTDVVNYIGRKQEPVYQLTESEIKEDFEWAWNEGFAKEVE
ncbi:DUF1642 domain-containing protein [Streptococcus suis]|nr:DUF1642 domain-containing protein [Streptococcus suis]